MTAGKAGRSVLFAMMFLVLHLRDRLVLAILRIELAAGGEVVGARRLRADGESRQQLLQIVAAALAAHERRAPRANEHLELVPAFSAFEVVERHGLRFSHVTTELQPGRSRAAARIPTRSPNYRVVFGRPRTWYDQSCPG